MDPREYARRSKEHSMAEPDRPAPKAEPARLPQAFPIPLQGNHERDLTLSLEMVAHELPAVRRRPSSWRWVIVALYDALGHALALRRPASYWPKEDLGQLTALFDAVAAERPELPEVREAVALIDRIRTTYIADAVARWPVSLKNLPGIMEDCLRVIRSLVPSAGAGCDPIDRLVS